jgi:hypothetical protein
MPLKTPWKVRERSWRNGNLFSKAVETELIDISEKE